MNIARCARDGARGACYRFVYSAGDILWGGAYWLTGGNNWGQEPGVSLTAASVHRVSFYAAEDGGMDNYQFIVGGVMGSEAKPPGAYDDQFVVQTSETLSSDWQKFEIDMPVTSDFQPPITSLVGAFAWAVNWSTSLDPQAGPPKTLYIDDLVYE